MKELKIEEIGFIHINMETREIVLFDKEAENEKPRAVLKFAKRSPAMQIFSGWLRILANEWNERHAW